MALVPVPMRGLTDDRGRPAPSPGDPVLASDQHGWALGVPRGPAAGRRGPDPLLDGCCTRSSLPADIEGPG